MSAHILGARLADSVVFNIAESLGTGDPGDCFLRLFKFAKEGKLKNYERFQDVCTVLEDHARRETSDNPNLKYGIRYSENYLNFMLVLRGYGQNSNRQYEILSATFAGPSSRHLR